MSLIFPILILIGGLVVLSYSADYFTEGAIAMAKNLHISTLSIGIFVLGFGTSAPEIVISMLSTINGLNGLAVGNVIGSNIANIGLVLGVAALICPIPVSRSTLRFETTLMIFVSITAGVAMLWDQTLNPSDGYLLLILCLVILVLFYVRLKRQQAQKPLPSAANQNDKGKAQRENVDMSLAKSISVTLIALLFLVLSARATVWGGSQIALHFNISDTLVGLTIIAIGTSLPELAAAISASLKKQAELTIGNIIGSNLFNLLIVLPFPAFIGGFNLPRRFIYLDIAIMLGLALLIPMALLLSQRGKMKQISRGSGILMLSVYITYIGTLLLMVDQ